MVGFVQPLLRETTARSDGCLLDAETGYRRASPGPQGVPSLLLPPGLTRRLPWNPTPAILNSQVRWALKGEVVFALAEGVESVWRKA